MATVLGCPTDLGDDLLLATALNEGFRLVLHRDVATGECSWQWQRDEPLPRFASRDNALRWMSVLLECRPSTRSQNRTPSG